VTSTTFIEVYRLKSRSGSHFIVFGVLTLEEVGLLGAGQGEGSVYVAGQSRPVSGDRPGVTLGYALLKITPIV